MDKQSYKKIIITKTTTKDAFDKICRIPEWWAKNFEGKSKEKGDVFTVVFKSGDMYKIKVAELVPNGKIVWDVIDSYQGWNDHHTEWNGTTIIWEISSQKDQTEVQMMHVGLVPEFACFESCSQGWNYLVEKSLQKLLDEDKGMPV
ncbi:MAG TPA: SRPBCC domain-containing protein [Candidatus Saccharimonadales bacterium]|nr:SRPBCC domain-containing protein [Candidatus Saccharimonadales bacterium]